MGGFKNLLLDEMMDDYIEESKTYKCISLYDKSLMSNLKLSNVFFRDMHVGLNEIIGYDSSNRMTLSRPLPERITVMTFTIQKSFSRDVLEIIKNSSDKLQLKIVFAYSKPNNKSHSEIEKIEEGITKAFGSIFKIKDKLTLSVIVNPHTHIKMLQIDDSLYMGSMNYSSAADAVNNAKLSGEYDMFANYEILFQFDRGGQEFSEQLWDKLKSLNNSVQFEINKDNYINVLKENFVKCRSSKIVDGLMAKEKITSELNNENGLKILDFIRHHISLGFRKLFYDSFKMNSHFRLDCGHLSYEEFTDIWHYFNENSEDTVVSTLLDLELLSFVQPKNQHEYEDDENDESFYEDFQSALTDILNDNKSLYLDELVMKSDDMRETILEDRYDYDDGEDIPWGENSEEEYERMIENNKNEVVGFLNKSVDEIALYIYEGDHYDERFFR